MNQIFFLSPIFIFFYDLFFLARIEDYFLNTELINYERDESVYNFSILYQFYYHSGIKNTYFEGIDCPK